MELSNIAIHGVPRSGTTWLGAIFDSSEEVVYRNQPLFSYAFKSFLTEYSSVKEIEEFFEKISKSDDEFLTQIESKLKGFIPIFNKNNPSHIVYKEARYHNVLANMLQKNNKLKVVGIIRNPKSVLTSWFNAPKEFDRNNWNFLEQWKEAELKNEKRKIEFYGYQKWKEVALMFLNFKKKFEKQFYLVNYKDLLTDTENVTKVMFDFCGLNFSNQTADFILKSRSNDMSDEAYSVYRNNSLDDKWMHVLPKEISNTIDKDLKGTELEIFLE